MHHEQSKSKCDGFQKKSSKLSVHRFEMNILQDVPKRISSWGSRNDDEDNKIMPAMVTTIGDSSRSVNSNQLVTLNNEQWKKQWLNLPLKPDLFYRKQFFLSSAPIVPWIQFYSSMSWIKNRPKCLFSMLQWLL
jgi:hypothetical protein